MLPAINQKIELKMKTPNCNLFNKSGFVIDSIKGVRQNSAKWDPPGTIRVFVGADPFPVRVIKLDRIVELFGKSVDLTKKDVQTWKVAGSKNNVYTVTRMGNDYQCNCVGFQYRKHCKHIEGVV
jgi:hypothetical protein